MVHFFFKEAKQFKKYDAGRLSASFYNGYSRSCGKNGKERSRTVKGIYAEATSTTRTWFKLVFAHIYKQPGGWWNKMKCNGVMGVEW